ncbi:Nuclear envelope morphology protein 1 [Savitreella phatthalungensis]
MDIAGAQRTTLLSILLLPLLWLQRCVRSVMLSLGLGRMDSVTRAGVDRRSGLSERAQAAEDAQLQAIADAMVTRAEVPLPMAGAGEKHDDDRGDLVELRSDTRIRATQLIQAGVSRAGVMLEGWAAESAGLLRQTLWPLPAGRKTLILDLDETLIHSLSKGNVMSPGHMVEVKLGQHAVLYYVHKRPHCDYFLRRVQQWYDVVVFTASIQEYADPVIDWLEQECRYFSARYYRQHCTYQAGAYMKDLTVCQQDLRNAIIIDNSPLSYKLNEHNAVPIEGWINDPTDTDLMYLVPLLQSLRYVDDVRSVLSLRTGG